MDDPNKINSHGFTRLQLAILDDDTPRVLSLIRKGADINFRGKLIHPPLHLALEKGKVSVALALLQAGADVDLQGADRQTPLHKAVFFGYDSFALSLLKMGAFVDAKDSKGKTPLFYVPGQRLDLADILLAHDANPNARDHDGNTPLHLFMLNVDMVKKLLAAKASPNIANDENLSVYGALIDDSFIQRHPDITQLLISQGADLDTRTPSGESILHVAARLHLRDIFSHAAQKGADMTALDHDGNTVLHTLAMSRHLGMINKTLQAAPHLVHERNSENKTPLAELLLRAESLLTDGENTFTEIARMLIKYGADPNTRDINGCSLLHHAVAKGNIALVEYLLDRGADPDLRDAQAQAPLHAALKTGNLDLLDRLLDRGADPDLVDTRGWTVLDRLAEKGDRDSPAVQRLIVAGASYQKQLPLHPELMRNGKKADRLLPAENDNKKDLRPAKPPLRLDKGPLP